MQNEDPLGSRNFAPEKNDKIQYDDDVDILLLTRHQTVGDGGREPVLHQGTPPIQLPHPGDKYNMTRITTLLAQGLVLLVLLLTLAKSGI